MKKVNDYESEIIETLKAHELYSDGLKTNVRNLAAAMFQLDLATRQVEGLEEVTVLEKTRYGQKLAPHPAFKILKEAQEQIAKNLKALKLTSDILLVEEEQKDDPLIDLTQKLIDQRSDVDIIRPE